MFNLILVDTNKEVVDGFQKYFGKLVGVESIIHGKFEDIMEYDAIVSPANSFGLMDGGIDKALVEYFGDILMNNVQQYLLKYFSGMQPVGTAMVVPTEDQEHPYLIHAPTMNVPRNIVGTDNVFYAFWAILNAVQTHNRLFLLQSPTVRRIKHIGKLVVPGLGTLTGGLTGDRAAKQMALAYKLFLNQPTNIKEMGWEYAASMDMRIIHARMYDDEI